MSKSEEPRIADDPPEVVVERMTNALKRALHTPHKPHEGMKVGKRPKTKSVSKRDASTKDGAPSA